MSLERILIVDDDPNLLQASRRVLQGTHDIVTALGGQEGIRAVDEQGPFAVVISDLRMPVIDGITLLKHVRQASPETVRILLTGNADTRAAIESVNDGQVFRFLTKPCPGSVIREALRDALRQHRLETSERVLTEHTLRGSIRALVEMLSLVHPAVSARTSRIRRLSIELAEALHAPDPWRIEVAALLSHVGYIALPSPTVERVLAGLPLGPDEAAQAGKAPEVSAKLIASIPRMEEVQDILLMHGTHWNGALSPVPGRSGDRIPLGARVLRLAVDFDNLVLRGAEPEEALEVMRQTEGVYDPAVLEALAQVRGGRAPEPDTIAVRVADLSPGMIFAKDYRTPTGTLVAAKGQEVTEQVLLHIRQQGDANSAETIVSVHFADPDPMSEAA